MKIHKTGLCRSVLVGGLLLALSCLQARAQTTAAQSAAEQTKRVPARVTETVDDTNRVALRGNVHPHARAEFDRGAVADAQPMTRIMLLFQRSAEQEAALRQLMEEQQSKGSANYHAWLTPDDFGKKFGPADVDVQAVTDWLTSRGFQNIKVGKGKTVVEFSGNVGQVRNAFGTEIHKFLVAGKERQANVSDPAIPAALKPVVAGIVSLNNFPRKSFRHQVGPFTRTADGRTIPQFTSSSGAFYAVAPSDFAKIYNIPPTLTGSGSTIAIIGTSNIALSDVASFQSLFGMTANPPTIVLNGPDPGIAGEEGEADLDVEWAGAVAPGAKVDLVVSEDTLTSSGIDLSSEYVIDNNSADVMSLSFGSCESSLTTAGNAFFRNLWEQAAAQGITVTVSAGDGGSAGCDDFTTAQTASGGLAVSGIASTPFNVAVGGTDFDDVGKQTTFWNATNAPGTRESAIGYIPETTWNDSCAAAATSSNLSTVCVNATAKQQNIVAGSGGPSAVNAKPVWQNGVTPADGFRDTPDISLFASDGVNSLNFYPVCQADALSSTSPPSCAPDANGHFGFLGVGGTSAAAPSFAGIVALLNQKMVGRQGNVNYVLYKLAATATNVCSSSSFTNPTTPLPNTCIFYDVTKGNNSVPCAGNSPNCSSKTSGTNGVLVDPAHTTTPAWTTSGTGYTYATGLGSVNVTNLANAWATAVGGLKPTTTALTINGNTSAVTITHGMSVTAAATVTAASGTPTGEISLIAPSAQLNNGIASGTLASGAMSFTGVKLPGGTYTVNAHYAGDGTFAPSDSSPGISVTVNKENSGLQMGIVNATSTNATSFAYGSPYILRMDILNSSGAACQAVTGGTTVGCAFDARGSLVITDNGSPLDAGTFPVNSNGSAEDQPIQLAPGTHNLSATYSGDASYNPPASPTTSTLTVTKAITTAKVTPNVSSIVSGGSVTLTAIISSSSNGEPPCGTGVASPGTVQFKNGSAAISGAQTGQASCTATLTTTLSQLVPLAQPRPKLRIPGVPLWIAAWLAILFLALARRSWPQFGKRLGYAAAGLVFFACLAAGFAGCSGSSGSSGGGTHTDSITAVYSGDANYAGSTSLATPVTVQ
jgi:hypothetical protein